jgi:orotate phosphoribosyltransferase
VTLSFPKIRTYIRQQFVNIIQEEFGTVDMIAGVATGGIPQGALVAQELGLPFVYVRTSAKDHGTGNLIEGRIEDGKSVVIVEDLVSTGKSSLVAVDALRAAGCNVKGMVAIFTYGLEAATSNFKKAKVKLITLSDYPSLLQKAVESNYIHQKDLQTLMTWRENPEKWGR